jgi:hypothetical protein
MTTADGSLTKRARLNDTGDGWLFEDTSVITPVPDPGGLVNLITMWMGTSYSTFAATDADITSAISLVAGSYTASTGLFWIDDATSYTITATLTLNSGEAPTLSYLNNGVSVDQVLVNGANVIVFTSVGTQSVVSMTNTLASNWSCTFIFAET